jgi:A/G-specific adenine glycosylase
MRSNLAKSPAEAIEAAAQHSPALPLADDLLAWYGRSARLLPWRIGPADRLAGIRPDPYRVWLSEVMLQQTTVKAVAPYFQRFVQRWPHMPPLQRRPRTKSWRLGGARLLLREHATSSHAHAPSPPGPAAASPRAAELRDLPASATTRQAAIAALAFDEQIAVVDGNVERVIARLFASKRLSRSQAGDSDGTSAAGPADHARRLRRGYDGLSAPRSAREKAGLLALPMVRPVPGPAEGRQSELPVNAVKQGGRLV